MFINIFVPLRAIKPKSVIRIHVGALFVLSRFSLSVSEQCGHCDRADGGKMPKEIAQQRG